MNAEQEFAKKLNAIIETAIDGIITIDSRGRIESVNNATISLFLYEREEMIGRNVSMLMPEPDKSMHDSYLSNYLSTKVPKIIGIGREVRGRKKDRSTFPFRLAVSEVVLNDRILFTGIIHDLSETNQAKKELMELNDLLEEKIAERTDELEHAINKLIITNRQLKESEKALTKSLESEQKTNELKSRFITTASHEFRTPLSTILSSASLISRYSENTQQSNRLKHIGKIKNSVNHLTGILNDFLDLSKLEEGKVSISNELTSLIPLTEEIFEELEGIKKPGQNLILKAESDIQLITDRKTMKNIFFNLLSNAIKYSNQGDIKVELSKKSGLVEILIEDHGMGIPKKDQEFLFERFFRARNVENIQGSGLGLSIVKKYLDLLDGTITFSSEEGRGTQFYLKIPSREY